MSEAKNEIDGPVSPGRLSRIKFAIESLLSSDSFKIFVGLFVLYMLTFKTIQVSDAAPNIWLPVVLLKHGTLSFDSLGSAVNINTYLFYHHAGHAYSAMGPGTSIAAIPIYLVPTLVLKTVTQYQALILSKISASFMVALSAVFLYLSARKLSDRRTAVFTALIFGIATSVFAMSSQMLLNFTGAILFLSIGLYFLLAGNEKKRNLVIAGLAFGWAGLCQPLLFLIMLIFGLYVLVKWKRDLVWYAVGVVPIVLITGAYQWISYGSPLKTGEMLSSVYLLTGKWNAKVSLFKLWSTPIWKGLAGTLFSPSRGIFIWTPILLFSIVGLGVTIKRRGNSILYYCAAAAMTVILVSSLWIWWEGSNGYGYRITLSVLPFMVLLLVPAIGLVRKHGALKVVFAVLLAFSVFVQFVGYLSYDGGSWEWTGMNSWSLTKNQLVWEVSHFSFYIPYVWREVVAYPIKVSILGTSVKPSKKPGYVDVSFRIKATQIGSVELQVIQESVEQPDGTVAGLATGIIKKNVPRGESTVTMPAIKQSNGPAKLVFGFDDEWGTESTRSSMAIPNI